MNDKPPSDDLITRIEKLERELTELKQSSQLEIQKHVTKYKRILDATSEGFLELNLKSEIIDHNHTIVELLCLQEDRLLGSSLESLYDPNSVFVHFASKDHLNFEATCRTRSCNTLPLLFKRSILRQDGTAPSGYLVFITDLTEVKRAQDDLQLAESKYREIYKNAVQGMYQCSLSGHFLRMNPAFAQTFGYTDPFALLAHPEGVVSLYKDPEERTHLLSILLTGGTLTNYEVEMKGLDERPVWALISARLAKDDNGDTIIEGILIDNTKKRMAEDKLRKSRERFRYLANHDSLTGLYNTRYLYKALDDLIDDSKKNNRPFSLVFLDMDNFKFIVDTYGHLNGSQALKEVATTLKQGIEEPAFGVAYGGDEFVLVLPQAGKETALMHAEKIRNCMKETRYLTKHSLEVEMSASFGIATYPEDATDREGILALADEAMFRVKSRGKDAIGVTQEEQEIEFGNREDDEVVGSFG